MINPSVTIDDETTQIILTVHKTCLVDTSSLILIRYHSWSAVLVNNRYWYAYTCKGPRLLYMHNLIAGTKRGEVTDHINFNTLDNRRKNLRSCSNMINLQHRADPLSRGANRGKYISQLASSKIKER